MAGRPPNVIDDEICQLPAIGSVVTKYPVVYRKARLLWEMGLPYRDIAGVLRCRVSTTYRWLSEKKQAYDRAYKEANKTYIRSRNAQSARRRRNDPLGRAKESLVNINRNARRRGHAGCTANPQEIVEAYIAQDSRCAICRTHESDCTARLHVDHCHTSGAFRGLLCKRCNHSLYLVEDYAQAVISYLRGQHE